MLKGRSQTTELLKENAQTLSHESDAEIKIDTNWGDRMSETIDGRYRREYKTCSCLQNYRETSAYDIQARGDDLLRLTNH